MIIETKHEQTVSVSANKLVNSSCEVCRAICNLLLYPLHTRPFELWALGGQNSNCMMWGRVSHNAEWSQNLIQLSFRYLNWKGKQFSSFIDCNNGTKTWRKVTRRTRCWPKQGSRFQNTEAELCVCFRKPSMRISTRHAPPPTSFYCLDLWLPTSYCCPLLLHRSATIKAATMGWTALRPAPTAVGEEETTQSRTMSFPPPLSLCSLITRAIGICPPALAIIPLMQGTFLPRRLTGAGDLP